MIFYEFKRICKKTKRGRLIYDLWISEKITLTMAMVMLERKKTDKNYKITTIIRAEDKEKEAEDKLKKG